MGKSKGFVTILWFVIWGLINDSGDSVRGVCEAFLILSNHKVSYFNGAFILYDRQNVIKRSLG